MKRPYFLCILIFCCATDRLASQPAPDQRVLSSQNAEADAWEAARQSIVLLRNEGELLPLKKLDEHVFSWWSVGLGQQNVFEKTLNKYRPASPQRKFYDEKDILVMGINADSLQPNSPIPLALEQRAKFMAEKGSLVLAIFGNSLIVKDLPMFSLADALLFVPSADSLSQSLAAQVIFGGCAANGLSTSHIRLGYAPPSFVGLDGQLMADSIRAIVEEGIRAQAFPGAQVLVAKDGMVVFHQTYGFQTYDSLQPVRPDGLYDFASVTKVTSTLPALMRLYGEGKFDLDAPLKTYLPFFKKSDKADVTYRQFLAHNGRLKPSIVFWSQAKKEDGSWKRRSFRDHYSRRYPIHITDSLFLFKKYKRQIYKGIRDLPLNQKSGYVYSDLSFILYPKVVEKLTGESLEPYLKETFYRPLGAFTLTYNPLGRFSIVRIVPTERDTFFRRKQIQGTVHDETAAMLGGVSGHAGLFGTAGDLAKLVQMYLNGGEYGGERFISEAAVREFTRCQYCPADNRRGLGFDKPLIEYDAQKSYVAQSASPESFGHSGYTGTFFWADPTYNLLVIFFSNRVYPDRSHTGISDLNIRPRVQQAVYDAMR
ncbi:MAG: serine hydrolase [Saprospiraceae bacterium]|nr:serine hydrolase [Saprospiraceae bacterium]MCF8252611.1 serine hydrolase [Saprospiraceae bacterium]MCF8282680.1 serine hydrolase [Bacteroidales bacterium]MCF8314183.1 serine hydrolase [Saprospiraceae bacterium]MCF8442963.1 serine hydrolase [Saprospiraceae bacterium]